MAELRLSRAEARGEDFPALCMQCGQPATDYKQKKFSTDQADVPAPPPPEPIGCLILWPFFGLVKLLSWATAKTMIVRTPLCHKHAHGWFNWSALEANAITNDEIVLKNVSEEFIAAWKRRPALPRVEQTAAAKQIVKVRCPVCQTLNEEDAKFCKQCGGGL
jgi:hypothetical protein